MHLLILRIFNPVIDSVRYLCLIDHKADEGEFKKGAGGERVRGTSERTGPRSLSMCSSRSNALKAN